MPSLSVVRASNASYAPSYIPTAVFIGGTSGIGEAMAKLLARQTNGRANIIIVGRNKAAAERTIAEFPTPPSVNGVTIKHEFLYCDASSLENVHTTSQELITRLDKINLLVLSLSTYGLKPIPTADGLELATVLRYYARAKFMHELMPLLEKARVNGEDAKVMSVLCAAMGVKVDMNDLGIKKWGFLKIMGLLGTYTDIMVKLQSERHPDIAFMHIYPGIVDTPAGPLVWPIVRLLRPVLKHLIWTPADCAENMMYALLNPEFGKGPYWLGRRGDKKTLGNNINEDIARKVWEHTVEVAKLQ